MTITLQAPLISGGKGGAGRSSLLHTKLKGTNVGICECNMDVKSTWIPTWHQMDRVSWSLGLISKPPPLGGRPNTKPLGDHRTPNTHNHHMFIPFYHVWRPTWIKIPKNSIWSKARSHTTSRYTRRSVTTPLYMILDYDRGAPAVSYRWTGRVWEITGWCSRLHENYQSV